MPNDDTTQEERGPIDGRSDWLAALREAFLAAPDAGVREMVLVDASFDDWPLGEPAVIDALTRWLRLPGRRMRMAGLTFDGMQGSQPRFAGWRRSWTHAIEVVAPLEVKAADMPCLLVSAQPPMVLELFDRDRFRGRLSRDAREARLATDRVAALLQRSEPSWPANSLGL
jgi:hypothetical protein